jgi:hypothetical protein
MTAESAPAAESDLTSGRPLVFRHATVLTMDDAHTIRPVPMS